MQRVRGVLCRERQQRRFRNDDEREQKVVQLMLVAQVRALFEPDGRDSVRRKTARFTQDKVRHHAAHGYRAGPAFFQIRIVEKILWNGVDQLVRELRWRDGIHREASDLACVNPPKHIGQPFKIHRLLQCVFHDFAYERMIGDFDIALDVFLAGSDLRKDIGEKIVGAHTHNLRRDLFPFLKPKQLQTSAGRPAPARFEERRGERSLLKKVMHGRFCEELKDIAERERVLLGKRDIQAVVCCGGLQFKIKAPAEAFAQGQSPGFVDTSTKGCMQDKLHATTLIEESLRNNRGKRGHGAKHGPAVDDIGHELQRCALAEAALLAEP